MEISQDNLEIFFDNDNPFLTKLTEDKMVGMEGELTLPAPFLESCLTITN
jgi:hypothetical protein